MSEIVKATVVRSLRFTYAHGQDSPVDTVTPFTIIAFGRNTTIKTQLPIPGRQCLKTSKAYSHLDATITDKLGIGCHASGEPKIRLFHWYRLFRKNAA